MNDKLEYGDFAKSFEEKITEKTGAKGCLCVNSFFSAIDLTFEALNVSEGDEVILSSFSPVIYLNVILKRKAKPVLCDHDERFFKPGLESVKSLITEKTKCIIIQHQFGYSLDTTPFKEIFPDIIEDITSVIGAKTGENIAGTNARYAIADLSSKEMITTGDGGAVFAYDRRDYKRLEELVNFDPAKEFQPIFNCLIPDLNAAMGVSQLHSYEHRVKLRENIGKIYEDSVTRSRNSFIAPEENNQRIYSEFPVIIKSGLKDAIFFFKKNGIEAVRPYEYPLHHYLKLDREMFPNTERFYLTTLLVPINSILVKKEVEKISKVLSALI